MKNKFKIFLITLVSLGALYLVCNVTNVFRFYKSPAISGYPNIKRGETFFTSVLKKPKLFDLICFHADIPNEGHTLVVQRLCGLPGDTIEIKHGTLYINNKNADYTLSLSNFYFVPTKDFDLIQDYEKLDEDFILRKNDDTLLVNFSDKTIKNKNLKYQKVVTAESIPDTNIYEIYKQHWNNDNFGPLIIPPNKYFVLGDNRPNSFDSRYQGLIDQNSYVATVLFK